MATKETRSGINRAGSRKAMRVAAAGALVALLAFAAAPASAESLSMTFTEARADVGVQLSDAALFAPPATAPLAAQIDPGSGSITAGELTVPQFSTFITDPVDADVAVDFEIGTVTGTFSQATGALSLSGTAGGTLTADSKECSVATVPPVLTLTTAGSSGGTSARSGAPFSAGLTGPGAIAGQWTDMTATPIGPDDTTVCETVDDRIGGPGGVWLVQAGDTAPPAAPQTGTPISHKHAKPPTHGCIVPKLVGKTLAAAKAALRRAGCKLGKVHRPHRPKGKRHRALVVKSSNPPAGSSPANSKVHLKLRPKPRPTA